MDMCCRAVMYSECMDVQGKGCFGGRCYGGRKGLHRCPGAYTDAQGLTYALAGTVCYVSGYTNEISPVVTIPESVYADGKRYTVAGGKKAALAYCTTLQELNIPNSVADIGEGFIEGCDHLARICIRTAKISLEKNTRASVIITSVNSALLNKSADVILEVDREAVDKAVSVSGRKNLALRVFVTGDGPVRPAKLKHIAISQEAVQSIAGSKMNFKVKVTNADGSRHCIQLPNSAMKQITADVKLTLADKTIEEIKGNKKKEINKIIKKNRLNDKRIKLVRFGIDRYTALKGNVRIYAADIQGIKSDSLIYAYRYDKAKKKCIATSYHRYKVSKRGNITIFGARGGIYILTEKKLKYMAEPLRSCFYREGHHIYYADAKGKPVYGWRKIKGHYYYFNRKNGRRASHCTVDGIKISKNGRAKKRLAYARKIQTMIKARNIVNRITHKSDSKKTKMRKCFHWIFQFPYRRYRRLKPIYKQKGWEVTFANDIFDRRQGDCVSEASALAFMFHECGVKNAYICHDTGHSWVEVGGRVYDPLFAEARGVKKYYNVSYKRAHLHLVGKRKV